MDDKMTRISDRLRVDDGPLEDRSHGSQPDLVESSVPQMISIGAFGRAVGRHLRDQRSKFGGASSDHLNAPGNSAVILAASHPAPALCESLASLAQEKGLAFLPVVIDESILRLGPIIVPGLSGCWRCWIARYRQHDAHPRETAALHDFYNSHPESGPGGYLEPFAWIVASQVAAILDSRAHLERWAGRLWQLDIFSREVTTGELVGVDGCCCCGLHRPQRSRTYAEMQRSLAYLWRPDEKAEGPETPDSGIKAHSVCTGEPQ
jgi:bacteriocin biosynthesis cyclodehydratase domain-containing protein